MTKTEVRTKPKNDTLELRPVQRQAVHELLSGNDVVAVLPTGAGKSLIYQTAGERLDGVCVVISPLLALQEDQIRSINERLGPCAGSVDGDSTDAEIDELLGQIRSGTVKFLFCTPEILTRASLLEDLRQLRPGLLAIDEAHCIVTWGQSYRPAYLGLGERREALGRPTTVALTASADPLMRDQIAGLLGMDDPSIIVSDLDRPGIRLAVRQSPSKAVAKDELIARATDLGGKILIYVGTRALTEEIARALDDAGVDAIPYHGGLGTRQRSTALARIQAETDVVVCATTAFGMGIDVSDIGAVLHLDMPESLIAFYQEIGRAGRDGRPAIAEAFIGLRKRSRRAFAGGSTPATAEQCTAVAMALSDGLTAKAKIKTRTGLTTGQVSKALFILERAGAVTRKPRLRPTGTEVEPTELERLCHLQAEFDRSQVEAVRRFRTVRSCRWSQILATLGQATGACGHCDVCDVAEAEDQKDGLVGAKVEHREYGRGKVTSVEDTTVSIAFDQVGPKTLDLRTCLERNLVVIDLRSTL